MKTRKVWVVLFCVLLCLLLSYVVDLPLVEMKSNQIENSLTTNTKEDLGIVLTTNQTTIGKNNGIKGELVLTNNGANPVGNVSVNFNLTKNYVRFTNKYPANQTTLLINQGDSVNYNIEVELNSTAVENQTSADVVLLFDSSGSMGNEIASVKEKFLEIADTLSGEISSLRMGMVVYGWSKYSEYPTSSVHNYVELTSDLNAIYSLINELTATGGVEPWGDAFSLINNWDWREDAPKLAIIVGDEDCDPGHIVGVGQSGSYYNGSQLLNVITSLKEKNVKINSVITEVTEGIIENQFQWIAEYTSGECVYLEELQSGENPIDLPELIEQWTIQLSRERYLDLTATINWTELIPDDNQDYNEIVSQKIIVDLAPPSITVSTIISPQLNGKYSLEIYAKPIDPSGIGQVNLYWSLDLFIHPSGPTWYFKVCTTVVGGIYAEKIKDLNLEDVVSFYIEASDLINNVGLTSIFNITITYTPIFLRTITEFIFTQDNSIKQLLFNFTDFSILNDPQEYPTGYLWIDSQDSLNITLLVAESIDYITMYNVSNSIIQKITCTGIENEFSLIVEGNSSTSSIKIRWDFLQDISTQSLDDYSENLDEIYRSKLLKVNLIVTNGSGYLSLLPKGGDELYAWVHIFDENWNKIAKIGTNDPKLLENGIYFLWIEQAMRYGMFALYFEEAPVTTPGTDYTPPPAAPGFTWIITLVALIAFIIYSHWHRAKKGKS